MNFNIQIKSDDVAYNIDIMYRITVLQKDSATGKTSLYDLLSSWQRQAIDLDITMDSNLQIHVVYPDQSLYDVEQSLSTVPQDKFILLVMDEMNVQIFNDKTFKDYLVRHPNYYVLTPVRERLRGLPLHGQSIQQLCRENGVTYNQICYHMEANSPRVMSTPVLIMDEDSGSGFILKDTILQILSKVYTIKTVSGIRNMRNRLLQESDNSNTFLLIFDYCGVGHDIENIISTAQLLQGRGCDVQIIYWESFEWYLLNTPIISANYKVPFMNALNEINIEDWYYNYLRDCIPSYSKKSNPLSACIDLHSDICTTKCRYSKICKCQGFNNINNLLHGDLKDIFLSLPDKSIED